MSRAENFTSEAEHNDAGESFDRQHAELQIVCEKMQETQNRQNIVHTTVGQH